VNAGERHFRWMLTSDADTIRAATAATLRTVAEWGPTITREEFLAVAEQVEAMTGNDGWCCPVCEEVECDDGCPLEPVRRPL
jgi:hypothetical protein